MRGEVDVHRPCYSPDTCRCRERKRFFF
ncbi:hypothetical protein [Desulfopila sp. IMCC35008]